VRRVLPFHVFFSPARFRWLIASPAFLTVIIEATFPPFSLLGAFYGLRHFLAGIGPILAHRPHSFPFFSDWIFFNPILVVDIEFVVWATDPPTLSSRPLRLGFPGFISPFFLWVIGYAGLLDNLRKKPGLPQHPFFFPPRGLIAL